MALAEMCKARLIVHKSAADKLAVKLQSLGCCEFAAGSGPSGGGAVAQLREELSHVEELLGDTRFVMRLLEPLQVKKGGSLSAMLGDKPKISLPALAAKADEAKFTSFTAVLREKEKASTEYRADISRLRGLLSQATLLAPVKYPLELFTTGTDAVAGAIYTVPKAAAAELKARVDKELGAFAEYQEIEGGEKDAGSMFAILCRREDAEKLQTICTELSAGRVDVPKELKLTAKEEMERLKSETAKAEAGEAAVQTELAASADEGLTMAHDCGDYWAIRRDRLNSMLTGDPTDEVLIWSLWTPKNCLAKVEQTVKEFEPLVEFTTVEPDEGEMPPTLLRNPGWSSCVEPLTLMYGTPTYGGTDPSTLMAPFFFLFIGMCFGDAGYGLILTAILGYLLVKHDLSPVLRKFFIMLLIGMGCTIVFGAITFSWFGDSISAFAFLKPVLPFFKSMQILDPMNDPMTLLVISLALGFAQIIFGLLIAMHANWKSGDKTAALCDQGGWIVFLFGLVLMGMSMGGVLPAVCILPTKIMAIAGALILVATQGRGKQSIGGKIFSGVMSLYNVTGFLGDTLSYSRLLALGLGSAAIGMVINLLANLVCGTRYVGIPIAILIFVLGHSFSIAVNLLGAFIHPLRLQYVEFFGKFYDANGSDFTPLRNSAQYSKLTDSGSGSQAA